MPKIRYNFTVDEEVLEMAKKLAQSENRSVSNLIEYLIIQASNAQPLKQSKEDKQ